MNYENNIDPYAWGTIKPLDSLLKKQKQEEKAEELRHEDKIDKR